jgi:hypothetical protein
MVFYQKSINNIPKSIKQDALHYTGLPNKKAKKRNRHIYGFTLIRMLNMNKRTNGKDQRQQKYINHKFNECVRGELGTTCISTEIT